MTIPFKGIAKRPYDQALLKGVPWEPLAPELMDFSGIWLTQAGLNIAGIFGETFSTDPYPHIVEWERECYLEDGHHRLVVQAAVDRTYLSSWVRRLRLP